MADSIAMKINELAEKIPLYRGYADLEERRETDKELRESTAAAFASQVSRITRVQEQAIKKGDFDSVETLDEAINRMQHLVDRLRSASYGYTGLFDQDRVDAAVLERLYNFDLEITKGVERVGDLIAQMGSVSDHGSAQMLLDTLDELHQSFDRRRDLLVNPHPAPAPAAPPLGSETPTPYAAAMPPTEEPIEPPASLPEDEGPLDSR